MTSVLRGLKWKAISTVPRDFPGMSLPGFVPRRHPRMSADDTEKAAGLYRAGDSLGTIGEVFGVDPGTVRRALIKLGVPMRDCHGNEQVASS